MGSCQSSVKFVGGIQINEPSQEEWAQTLVSSGMNTAQVTAYAKQGIWNSDHLWWEQNDTTHIINEIRELKAVGLNVVLVLRISLQHEFEENGYKWHGMIFPNNSDKLNEWFYRYSYFVEMWAKICEREQVDVLVIGSELSALTASRQISEIPSHIEYMSNREKQQQFEGKIIPFQEEMREYELWDCGKLIGEDVAQYVNEKINSNLNWSIETYHVNSANQIDEINQDRNYLDSNWRSIISRARLVYKGKLTLAANFDNYQDVSFWDDLDFLGINAYFPLRQLNDVPISNDSIYDELIQGWHQVFKEIKHFTYQQNIADKPLFFTEIGYTKKENCTVVPWAGGGINLISKPHHDTLFIWEKIPENPEERIMAVNALHEVIKMNEIPLIGLNYWKFSTKAYHAIHEPFMLLIEKEPSDSLQSGLTQFLKR